MPRSILIAAGGTGGHLFPAQALAHELLRRGWRVHLATDARASTYLGDFPAEKVHIVASATFQGRSFFTLLKSVFAILKGFIQSLRLVRSVKPAVAVGFGGYPTLPPLLAALLGRIPILIHEANAVPGRANRFLAPSAKKIALGFPETSLTHSKDGKIVFTGNPLRPQVLAASRPYAAPEKNAPFLLTVFGGSQGAHIFSRLIPDTLALLPEAMRRRIRLTQQVRAEDRESVDNAFARLGIAATLAPFFGDLPEILSRSHLVICRSGASSVSELAVLERPSILVPLPHARDNDQKANALAMQKLGGALLEEQATLTPEKLRAILEELIDDPHRLTAMAAAAKELGRKDAASVLADCVEACTKESQP